MDALNEGERALRLAHWPELDGPWSAEKFATSGKVTSALLKAAREHFSLLERRVKLRLLVAAGCLRASEAAGLGDDIPAFIQVARGDDDRWVRAIARVIGEQRGCVDRGALLPEEEALIQKLAPRVAEAGVSGLLRPEEDPYLGMCATVDNSRPHFSVAGDGEGREKQRLAAAEACRLPKVAWEKTADALTAAPASATVPASQKRAREHDGTGGSTKVEKARTEYQKMKAKRQRLTQKHREAASADSSASEMKRKDDHSFKELEQKKALEEQEKVRRREEEQAARKKKMEERDAARREEARQRRGGAVSHGLRGPEAALPAWLLDKDLDPRMGDALDPQGFVYRCKYNQLGDMAYYMDRKKRYPFYTDEEIGGAALINLMSRNEVLLQKNMGRLQNLAQGDEAKLADLLAGGKHIYDTKPTLSATRGTEHLATWSQEEYGQPGLQREYLIYKSLQRFTETWALLERATTAGLFAPEFLRNKKAEDSDDDDDDDDENDSSSSDEDEDDVQPIRVASVGGGPGYELFATREFFARYVLEMYMTTEYCCDMMADWLKDKKVRAIIISSRSPTLDAKAMMEKRGVVSKHLLAQPPGGGRDERQTLFVLPSTLQEMAKSCKTDEDSKAKESEDSPPASVWMSKQFVEDSEMFEKRWKNIPTMHGSRSVFPNVPFEDNKQMDDTEPGDDGGGDTRPADVTDSAADSESAGKVSVKDDPDTEAEAKRAGQQEGSAGLLNDARQSPTYQPGVKSPTYAPASPGANSPTYLPASPGADSPTYAPASPGADSPTYAPASPGADSPTYAPASPGADSPAYAPASPGTN